MESAVWGLIGTIVGASASTATTWLSNQASSKRQREQAREDRAERSNIFQRQTLLELQGSIHDALRLVNRAYIEDCNAHRTTKNWTVNMLTDEVNEGIRLAHRSVAILVERVSEGALRTEVKTLMSSVTSVLLARSEREAKFQIEKTSADASLVLERIGTVLRKHY